MSLEPFSLPDRYRLEGGIASGGMAAVYAAHDTVLNRPVAVKVLADHLNDDPMARRRFEREGRAAAGLSSHPGVVTIFDVGEYRGRAFMVMERREGGTLADAGRVSRERALGWLRTVAEALDAAHAQGVVHRDIKPANLLLDDQDRVAVADFGIAQLAAETERFTQTGQVLGPASYLAPEQAAGEPATEASDRYSLAVVAYELLSGQRPFTSDNFAAQARAHLEDTPPPAPGLPRGAQEALHRGLAKRPQDRWPTAVAFVDALEEGLGAPTPPPPPVAPTRATVPMAPERRRPWLIPAAIVLLIALIAGIALAASGGNDGKPATQARKTPAPQKHKKAKPTPTATPTAAATEAPATATPAQTTSSSGGDPAALHAQGFSLLGQGDYAGAVDPLRQAVAACHGSGPLDPCGYAYYNYGLALNRSGDPNDAIPVLESRLKIWGDNSSGDVQRELDSARANAGEAPAKSKPEPPGKAKGHKK